MPLIAELTEIGKEFGISNYSTVSTIIERMRSRISGERSVDKRVGRFMENIKRSHLKTPFREI